MVTLSPYIDDRSQHVDIQAVLGCAGHIPLTPQLCPGRTPTAADAFSSDATAGGAGKRAQLSKVLKLQRLVGTNYTYAGRFCGCWDH
jgi:hypothetical protein